MAYFVRLFTPSREHIAVERLQTDPRWKGLLPEASGGSDGRWNQLDVVTSEGRPFCLIDRDERGVSDVFAEEIDEFIEMVEGQGPPANVEWVRQQLRAAHVTYAARYLSGAFEAPDTAFSPFDLLLTLKDLLGGITQADAESFGNLDGYAVTLDFAETAKGEWQMALLQPDGSWVTGPIELGDMAQRAAFIAGRLPG